VDNMGAEGVEGGEEGQLRKRLSQQYRCRIVVGRPSQNKHMEHMFAKI
jgi:hypothetical protein